MIEVLFGESESIRMYHFLWDELRKDNAPLRTVINGKIIGVSKTTMSD